ncbi:MAG: FGGY-family carbohydrate kinase [Sphaerochaetaceae bacterium]|nr:FGGY-family carbohydrate kinase [Sphaerochaetaceae bacterium]
MILTIDIGTTNCKAALFSEDGAMIHYDTTALDERFFFFDGTCIDPKAFSIALRHLFVNMPKTDDLEAIIVTGSGPSLVPVLAPAVYEDGLLYAPAALARLYFDRRAVEESREVSAAIGRFVDASFFVPKALYLARHEKALYDKAICFLSSYDYVNYLLTNELTAIMHAPEAYTWYYDDSLLDTLSLDREKFAPLIFPGAFIGNVSSLASKAFSIPPKAKVIAGGPDFVVSILGCSVVRPGMVCDRSGTSEGINVCSRVDVTDSRLMSFRHPIDPYYNISGMISTSGKAITWARNLLNLDSLSYEQMFQKIETVPPGANSLLFLPYLAGERAPIWDPNAKGVFSGLNLGTTDSYLFRAVVEGVSFAIRDVIETIEDVGQEVTTLRTVGGSSSIPILQQIKADITQREVAVPSVSEAEMVGAMVLAQYAVGRFSSLTQSCESLISFDTFYYPDTNKKALYDDLFGRYRSLYKALKGQWS